MGMWREKGQPGQRQTDKEPQRTSVLEDSIRVGFEVRPGRWPPLDPRTLGSMTANLATVCVLAVGVGWRVLLIGKGA